MGTAPSEACPGRGRTVAAVVLPGARWSPSELRLRVEGAPLATATSTWFWQSDHLLSVVSERVARVSDVANSRFTGRLSALYRPGKCRLVERHHPAAVTQRAKWPFRLAVRCQTCQVANLPDLENAPRQPHRRPETVAVARRNLPSGQFRAGVRTSRHHTTWRKRAKWPIHRTWQRHRRRGDGHTCRVHRTRTCPWPSLRRRGLGGHAERRYSNADALIGRRAPYR